MPLDGTTYAEPLTDTEIAARDDLWRILDDYPAEAPVVLAAAREGRIDGKMYSLDRGCGCVFAHIANANSDDGWPLAMAHATRIGCATISPLELFIYATRPGDTPATSRVVHLLASWIEQWQRKAEDR